MVLSSVSFSNGLIVDKKGAFLEAIDVLNKPVENVELLPDRR